jgi:hypothetical protein
LKNSRNRGVKGQSGFGTVGDDMKGSEDLINFLEGKLEHHEKNLIAKQNEYD